MFRSQRCKDRPTVEEISVTTIYFRLVSNWIFIWNIETKKTNNDSFEMTKVKSEHTLQKILLILEMILFDL